MIAKTPKKALAADPPPLRIVVPKGFPGAFGPAGESSLHPTIRSRLTGLAGACALHVAVLLVLFHVQALREAFGEPVAEEMDWTWLPEVAVLNAPPDEPPPPPPPPPEPPPKPPEPEIAPAEPPPVEIPMLVVPAEPEPEPDPEPEPPVEPAFEPMPPSAPPAVEIAASTNRPDAWTEVRAGILEALRYPAGARRSGTEGVVELLLQIDETGRMVSAEILPPAPPRALGEAVQAAVRRAGPFPSAGEALHKGLIPRQARMAIRFELADSRR